MKNKKKTLILTLIAVAVLITAVVGVTYAYFAVTIAGNQNASSIIAKSAQLGLIYTDGNEINVENIIPGWTTTKTFTVQNTGDAPIDYNIIWKELLNEIQNNDLVYSVTGTTTSFGETPVPLVSGPIITNIPINPGGTHEYTMTITFINRETDQNINQGKTFAGKIEINTEQMRDPVPLMLSEQTTETITTLEAQTFLGSQIQRQQIEEIEFVNHKNIPVSATGSWDVSNTQDEQIMAWYEPIGSNGRYKVTIGTNGVVKANENSSQLFKDIRNLNSLNFNNNFDTSNVTNMALMFELTGSNSTVFTLDLGNKFDTSNVTNMDSMFNQTGYSSTTFTLNLGNNFDTSRVTDMRVMFRMTGYDSTVFTLNLGDKFDTSQVSDMRYMFNIAGYSNINFTLDLGDNFDTSNVINMREMFYRTGYNSTTFTLDLGNKFDTSKVTDMYWMFYQTGYKSTTFTLDLGDNFDTSKVSYMSQMFRSTGYSSKVFTLDLGDKFNTSNVTDMSSMFDNTGYSSTTFTLDLGDNFDTSNVWSMAYMFTSTGYSNPNFNLNLGDKFNMSKVTYFVNMFSLTGNSNSNFTIYAPTAARTYILNKSATMRLKAGTNIIDCASSAVC